MIARARPKAIFLVPASLGILALVFHSSGAAAQDRTPVTRPAPHQPHGEEKRSTIPKGSIRIKNRDSSTLLSLSLTSDGGVPDVVARGVRSGASVVVQLPNTGECIYDIEARFEDWSWVRVPSFDLCKDPTLNVGESSSAASAPAKAAEAVSSAPAAASGARSASPAKVASIKPSASVKSAARLSSGVEKQTAPSRERVRVENHRSTMLLLLTLAIRGESRHVVAERVPSGASVVVALPEPGKCVYDIEGDFADNSWTSIPGFNLCKDHTLNFLN